MVYIAAPNTLTQAFERDLVIRNPFIYEVIQELWTGRLAPLRVRMESGKRVRDKIVAASRSKRWMAAC